MNYSILAAGLAALVLAGCGQRQSQPQANAAAAQANQTFSGTGNVTAVAGDQVSIAHGPIQGIGWPAMRMTFTAPSGMATGVKPGDAVSFSFRHEDSAYVLASLQKH